ncbi:MAG TPA: CYTH domain-containing protein [Gammaproteobacteria bacterium]|nr:CYTH domain-containing protein [Gammaproteobacteria bacterium]
MPTEIERKFLVKNDTWREQVRGAPQPLRQGYLALTERAVIRVRTAGDEQAWIGVKEHRIGRAHGEYEYTVPVEEAREMLALCSGSLIEKTRFRIPQGRHVWEVDEFGGDNTGLVLAEIELDTVDDHFDRPAWVGIEVTDDRRFYNAALSLHPWREFAEEIGS